MVNLINLLNQSFPAIVLVYIINALLVLSIIFIERKTPTATLAWIMVITFVPIVGFIIYLVFNQNLARSKINKRTEKEEFITSNAMNKQRRAMKEGNFNYRSSVAEKWKHMITLNQVYGDAYLTEDNDIRLITDGNEKMNMLLKDIRKAQKSINVEYFIIKRDFAGKQLIYELTKKAREGVDVRLLVDALGSRYIGRRFLKDYLTAGGKVGYFFKPKFIFFGIRFNYRNHRKIVVIDNEIAYTGGFNVAKEYLGQKRKFGYWRDTHIRIEGEAVYDLNSRFILDWRYTTKEKIESIPVEQNQNPDGNKSVQIVSCGPEAPKEEVKRAFMRMITSAKKNVYLQTPYFIPDPSILESLKMASQSGVDVRIMIPCMPDHIFVYWATYAYVGELLYSGARAFIYDNGFLHSKTMVVDGEVSTIGSANFDNRSFRLNFETNAFIYDQRFAQKMEDVFIEDMQYCHELTLKDYESRSVVIRLKEAISRLLSDIL